MVDCKTTTKGTEVTFIDPEYTSQCSPECGYSEGVLGSRAV